MNTKRKLFTAILAGTLVVTPVCTLVDSYNNTANAQNKKSVILEDSLEKYVLVDYKKNIFYLDELGISKINASKEKIVTLKQNITKMNELLKEKHAIIQSDKSVKVMSSNPYLRAGDSSIVHHWNGNITVYLSHKDVQKISYNIGWKSISSSVIGVLVGIISNAVGSGMGILSIAQGLEGQYIVSRDRGNGVKLVYSPYRDRT